MRIIIDFSNFKFPSVNKIIKLFTAADLLLLMGWGVITPLFAVFVVTEISGATVVTVGVVAGIYWITRALFQIPISLFLDKTSGEKDDFYSLVIGLMVISISSFSYMLVVTVWQIYLITFIKGLGFALYVPPWNAIFSRHLDREHTVFDWALHSSAASLSIGIGGLIGGWVVFVGGFKLIFLLAGLSSLAGASILLFVPDIILPRRVSADPVVIPPSITQKKI
ncbi:MFS transporter [Candidatus Wolfebacteria bacterium]|nr:MFS transporter [Candidatus Wolfebacteria bacterium]